MSRFKKGDRVRIVEKLPPEMAHFTAGKMATIEYSYFEHYGGDENGKEEYSIDIDGEGSTAWYPSETLVARRRAAKANGE
jgi:hypothetical protein